jgi:DNA-binding NtrC family response regulator
VTQLKLLAIDDLRIVLTALKKVAEEIGYEVEATQNPEQFKNLLRSFAPDLILLDVIMPGEDGLKLLQYVAQEKVTAPVILISDYGSELLNMVTKMGSAFGIDVRAVQKPLGPGSWRDLLAIEKARLMA